jgi:hypothetical protein
MSLTVYQIPLNCGHVRGCRSKPPPNIGDDVWCIVCGAYAMAIGYQWKLYCETCRYSKRVGLSEEWARSRAIGHLYRQGLHHIVRIWREDQADKTRVVTPDTPLPEAGELPF